MHAKVKKVVQERVNPTDREPMPASVQMDAWSSITGVAQSFAHHAQHDHLQDHFLAVTIQQLKEDLGGFENFCLGIRKIRHQGVHACLLAMLFDCLSLLTDAKSQAHGVKLILEDSKLNERREELRAVTDNTAVMPKTCQLLGMEQVPYCFAVCMGQCHCPNPHSHRMAAPGILFTWQ